MNWKRKLKNITEGWKFLSLGLAKFTLKTDANHEGTRLTSLIRNAVENVSLKTSTKAKEFQNTRQKFT